MSDSEAITTPGGSAASFARPRPFPAIVVGGLIVGILDLAYAILIYSPQKPILIPQTIASGILGMKSYSGGTHTAAFGVVLHFVIALGAAMVYYLASRKLPFLVSRAVVCGLIYGALVYMFMHIVCCHSRRCRWDTLRSSTRPWSSSSTGSASACPSRSRCVTTPAEFLTCALRGRGWPRDLSFVHSCFATPSSSQWWPHESQVHLYFWEESSVATTSVEVPPSKTTSVEWHLGQRTTSSSSSSSSLRFGSSSAS